MHARAMDGKGFHESATAVLGDLQDAVRDVLRAASAGGPRAVGGKGDITKAIDVDRIFGVDHPLGWRIYQISVARTPLAAAPHVPVRQAMHRFLKSASRRRIPAEQVQRVSRSFDDFERLVTVHAGSRSEFEALASAFVPEARVKQEQTAREAAYRAMSLVRGVSIETDLNAMFLHPSGDGSTADWAYLSCVIGFRRLRPDTHVLFRYTATSDRHRNVMMSLRGEPIDDQHTGLLDDFSTKPLPSFDVSQSKVETQYRLIDANIGLQGAVDIAMAFQHRKFYELYHCGRDRHAATIANIPMPVRRMVYDHYIHNDVYRGVLPRLYVHNYAARGLVLDYDQPVRDGDRLPAHETISALPGGMEGVPIPDSPRYHEMLRHVTDTLGWNPQDFRGYRLEVEFPIYGAQYAMAYELPEPASVAAKHSVPSPKT